jgi:hypothetical protein
VWNQHAQCSTLNFVDGKWILTTERGHWHASTCWAEVSRGKTWTRMTSERTHSVRSLQITDVASNALCFLWVFSTRSKCSKHFFVKDRAECCCGPFSHLVRTPARLPAVLIDVSRGFLQSLQTRATIMLWNWLWSPRFSIFTVPVLQLWRITSQATPSTGPSGRALRQRSWALGRWDCGFESRLRHVCLSFLSVLCCAVKANAFATEWPLVHRSSSNCVNRLRNLQYVSRPRSLQGL